MDKSNRRALRIVGLVAVLVMLGAVKVINVFNEMIQPPEPVALIKLDSTRPDKPAVNSDQLDKPQLAILGITVDIPVNQIEDRLQQMSAELSDRLRALPVEQIKSDLWEVGMETHRQMLLWWEGLLRTTRDDVASKKR